MRKQIVDQLEELMQLEELDSIAPQVLDLEEEYLKLAEEKANAHFENFKAEGGVEEEYVTEKHAEDGKFKELINLFKQRKAKQDADRKAEQENNFKLKKAIIEKLQKLILEEENIGKAFKTCNELKDQWKSVGNVSSHKYKDLQNDYSKLLEQFYYNINIYKELHENDLKKNLELKKGMIKQIEDLRHEKSIRQVQARMAIYLNEWDEVGPTYREQWDAIRDQFRDANKKVTARIKDHYQKLKDKQKDNLGAKQELVNKLTEVIAQEVNSAKTWNQATESVREIQQQWRKIGFATKKQNDKIWDEFKAACDEFFERKRKFHEGLKGDFDINKAKKEALITRAQSLKETTTWADTTDAFKRLQRDWKNIPAASQKDEQRLWRKFRAACDAFFDTKKNHFEEQDKLQKQNLEAKKVLLEKIEKSKIPTDKAKAIEAIQQFSGEWNAIGQVPRDKGMGLNKAFQKLVNDAYTKVDISKEEREEMQLQSRLEGIMNSNSPDEQFDRERKNVRERMEKVEATILQYENNLGFFANSKSTESLRNEVEGNIEVARNQILRLRKQLSAITAASKQLKASKKEVAVEANPEMVEGN